MDDSLPDWIRERRETIRKHAAEVIGQLRNDRKFEDAEYDLHGEEAVKKILELFSCKAAVSVVHVLA